MNKKNFFSKARSPYNTNNPRVRNSYYTFSREYPAGNIPLKRRINLRFKSENTKKSVYILATLMIVFCSFFSVRLLLDISYKTPAANDGASAVIPVQKETESILESDGFRALYMPYDRLGDTAYIRSFIRKAEKKDCNGVVIDFKTESGKLCYKIGRAHV